MLTVIMTNEILMLSRTIQKHIISPLSSSPQYLSEPQNVNTFTHSLHLLKFNQIMLRNYLQDLTENLQLDNSNKIITSKKLLQLLLH